MTRVLNAFNHAEQRFFRALNALVEPALRAGIGSPRCVPLGLVLLESKGFKSGLPRSTPLFAVRIHDHVLVSTGRGKRSLWVKNLTKTPQTRYWLAGRPHDAKALLIVGSRALRMPASLPAPLRAVARTLHRVASQGWAFAILAPVSSPS